jgi:hypothetical protein
MSISFSPSKKRIDLYFNIFEIFSNLYIRIVFYIQALRRRYNLHLITSLLQLIQFDFKHQANVKT